MLRRFSVNFALFSLILDGLAVVLGLWISASLRPMLNSSPWFEKLATPVLIPPVLFGAFPILWMLIFAVLSIYDGRKYLRAADEFTVLSLATGIASISSAGILYFSYRNISRVLFLLFVFFTYGLCLCWRLLVRFYFRTQNRFPDRARRVLVVGAGSLGQKVYATMLTAQIPNLSLVGFVDDEFRENVLGNLDSAVNIILEQAVSDVVIALPHSAYAQLGSLVQQLDEMPLQVWVALGFFDLALYNTTIEDFAGIPMLDLRASAIDGYQRLIKRAFDIFFGLLGLVLSLPLMALSALMIFLEDRGPVLFRQKRVGENGRFFQMLKFRTMVKNAEQINSFSRQTDPSGSSIYKAKDDPRVTRIGRFLRRFSLDELPQFFNVVRGDMSLVGPRPELPALVEKYQPWQRKRFAVPPGLTGWWQVSGRSDMPMHLHTEQDLYYIQNYSIWLDFQILIRTIWVVLIGKGAY